MQLSGVKVPPGAAYAGRGRWLPAVYSPKAQLAVPPGGVDAAGVPPDVIISLMDLRPEATRAVAGVGQGVLRIGTLYSLTLKPYRALLAA